MARACQTRQDGCGTAAATYQRLSHAGGETSADASSAKAGSHYSRTRGTHALTGHELPLTEARRHYHPTLRLTARKPGVAAYTFHHGSPQPPPSCHSAQDPSRRRTATPSQCHATTPSRHSVQAPASHEQRRPADGWTITVTCGDDNDVATITATTTEQLGLRPWQGQRKLTNTTMVMTTTPAPTTSRSPRQRKAM
ncbi:hypothetical protein EDB86DRAFT_1462808 [Lactarius hatsudake]|nr:hypothetical protein EDB86DRAFT_1462808 [Lactarius hatsudake]